MKFFFWFFLLTCPFSNYCFSEDKSAPDFKPTSEKLREQNISDSDLCRVACEAQYSKCHNEKKNALKCAGEILICKKNCK